MHELILVDKATGKEIGRRSMNPQERYQLYEDFRDHALLTYDARHYTIASVAWRIPEQDCVVGVTFHSHDVNYCDC